MSGINELETPLIALGITRKGIPDVATKKPIEVALVLSPARDPDIQVRPWPWPAARPKGGTSSACSGAPTVRRT
ncbi:MAG: hypothetical protein MZU79_02525 [Anaerotruncus sp.]|nr:hypothetical protein [Anaerotruncus sp.]